MVYVLRNEGNAQVDFDHPAIVSNDQEVVLVDCSFEEASQLSQEWHMFSPMYAKAGKHIAESGDELYIDDNGEIVRSAEEVLGSLGRKLENWEDADDVLYQLNRVF